MTYRRIACIRAASRTFPFLETVEDNPPKSLADIGFTLVPVNQESRGAWYHSETLYNPILYSTIKGACEFGLAWLDVYGHQLPPDKASQYRKGFQEKLTNDYH